MRLEAAEMLRAFSAMWEDPYAAVAARAAERGERPIGYLCSYAPEEIMHAAGFTPVRIVGAERTIIRADSHLQTYCCSLARTTLDLALTRDLDFLEGAVFVQTCDTMQRLSDIWRLNTRFRFHGDVVLPARMGEPAAERYIGAELRAFRKRIEEYVGAEVPDSAIASSIAVYNHNRDLCERLYSLSGVALTGTEVLSAVMAGTTMRKEEHSAMLERLLDALCGEEGPTPDDRVPLVVSGSLCGSPDFVRMVEGLGAIVVDDDLCCGHRAIEGRAPETGDPVEAVARRLSERPACPAKHSAARSRPDDLAVRVKGSGARGVIFYLQHFCDPHAFDYPALRARLSEDGIPSLLVEWEHQAPSTGQMRTRVEAFLEMIRGI